MSMKISWVPSSAEFQVADTRRANIVEGYWSIRLFESLYLVPPTSSTTLLRFVFKLVAPMWKLDGVEVEWESADAVEGAPLKVKLGG